MTAACVHETTPAQARRLVALDWLVTPSWRALHHATLSDAAAVELRADGRRPADPRGAVPARATALHGLLPGHRDADGGRVAEERRGLPAAARTGREGDGVTLFAGDEEYGDVTLGPVDGCDHVDRPYEEDNGRGLDWDDGPEPPPGRRVVSIETTGDRL